MLQKDPWWWPAVGIALGFALWLSMAAIWIAVMAVLYGIYVWFGGKALLAAVLIVIALLLHFQIKDMDEGLQGPVLQNLLVRWLRYRQRNGE